MAIERAWIRLMGFTSKALNRNFFISILCLIISGWMFTVSKFFSLAKQLDIERDKRIEDKNINAIETQKHELEKRQIMKLCDSTVYSIMIRYEIKLDKYLK